MLDETIAALYFVCRDNDEARIIARKLVEERLVACANILGPATSFFYWEGGVQEEIEVAVLAKTTKSKLEDVVDRLKGLHSYKLPAIIAFPVIGGNNDFLGWIGDEITEE